MSIVSIVYLPEGIAIAADSRLTGSQTKTADGTTTIKQFSISDNAQKIVLLNKCQVGIASVGDAIIEGKTISDYIRLFEINNITNGDTPEMVADKLLGYKSEYPKTIFYVCGYNDDIPYIFEINANGKTRKNIDESNNVTYNLMWNGAPEALTKLINAEPAININPHLMPLKDGIDLSEFMVDLTIKYQRFSCEMKTCGGPIDVLVLTKDDAFWYKHKLFKK
jgi:hypothetical protein